MNEKLRIKEVNQTTQEYFEMIFSELELSDPINTAKEELKDYLENEGYTIYQKVRINGTKKIYDIVATKEGQTMAIMIGRHSVRKQKVIDLNQFNGDRVYLLRGNARYNGYINNVNVINVMSKGNL